MWTFRVLNFFSNEVEVHRQFNSRTVLHKPVTHKHNVSGLRTIHTRISFHDSFMINRDIDMGSNVWQSKKRKFSSAGCPVTVP